MNTHQKAVIAARWHDKRAVERAYLKAAMIVYDLYGKDVVTEADRKLAACMSFIRFFSKDPCFNKRKFYDMCMCGTIVEDT